MVVQANSDDPKDTKTPTQDSKDETVKDLQKSEEFRKFKANPSIEAALKVTSTKKYGTTRVYNSELELIGI